MKNKSDAKIREVTNDAVISLISVPVYHCRNSFGLVLRLNKCCEQHPLTTFKMVYSGDCRPSESLQQAGHSCDLLIHEATFDDTLHSDACSKRHSTTSGIFHEDIICLGQSYVLHRYIFNNYIYNILALIL